MALSSSVIVGSNATGLLAIILKIGTEFPIPRVAAIWTNCSRETASIALTTYTRLTKQFKLKASVLIDDTMRKNVFKMISASSNTTNKFNRYKYCIYLEWKVEGVEEDQRKY